MLKSLRRKIFGDIRANRGQFFAVWLVVTLGVTFYGAMYPAGINMLNTFDQIYDDWHYLDYQVQFDPTEPAMVDDVRAIDGVTAVQERLIVESGLKIDPDHDYLITLRLISMPDEGQPAVSQHEITAGRDLANPGEILVLERFANHHGLKVGDTLTVNISGEYVDLTIAGIVFNPEYLVAGRSPTSPFPTMSTFGVAWMRYSELAELTGQTGLINNIVLEVEGKTGEKDSAVLDSVNAKLHALFDDDPSAVIYNRSQVPSSSIIEALINGNFPLMRFYSGIFLLGGTLITAILLARVVEGERQRIGTMRSLGVTRRELVIHYLTFGLIIGVTGGIAGSLLGYLNSFWVMDVFLQYIAGTDLPGFVNRPQWGFIGLGVAIAVTGTTLAGAYPAWSQSATPPGVALRPATPKTPHAISRLPLNFLPMVLRQTLRNLLRTPGRAIGTALGVIAGAMMVFSALAMWDTMNVRFGEFFDAHQFDLRVDLNTFQPGETLETEVTALDGVASAQAVLMGPTTVIRADGQEFDTIAVVMDETNPYFEMEMLDGAPVFSSADGVWIGNNAQRVFGINTGDTITLRALGQEGTFEVLGVTSYIVGSPIFVPKSLFTEWVPGGIFPANRVLVRAEPGRVDDARDALIALPGVVAAENNADFEADMNKYLEFFRVGTIIFGGFGYILTLALLFNTVNASLRERRDELSVLRALGSTPLEIALTVTLELLVMVVIGAIIGVPLGREVGYVLFDSYQMETYGTLPLLTLPYYVLGLASMLIVIFIAEIPGLRAVQRVDLGQVSKSQSF